MNTKPFGSAKLRLLSFGRPGNARGVDTALVIAGGSYDVAMDEVIVRGSIYRLDGIKDVKLSRSVPEGYYVFEFFSALTMFATFFTIIQASGLIGPTQSSGWVPFLIFFGGVTVFLSLHIYGLATLPAVWQVSAITSWGTHDIYWTESRKQANDLMLKIERSIGKLP